MATMYAYPRVSTEGQDLDPQTDELRKDGFDVLMVKKASGASRMRPELGRLVRQMKAGDISKVVRIDRLARSVSHLLEVIETLEKKGAQLRSCAIRSTPQRPRASSRCRCWARLPSGSER